MMKERHPGYGIIHQIEGMRTDFQYGLLMFIREPGGQAVAGGLFKIQSGYAILLANGILDGNMEWYEKGANSALYYYSLQWFHQNGFKIYDAGNCRPFVTDGLYEYKRRWGLSPVRDLWSPREWLFWLPDSASAAMEWLEANQEIVLEKRPDPSTPG
ncbi:MAG: hypothetical protein IH586_21380 [Anaerolineaceae bacterium]|nr:hypothetical protein [Anaerolineaceae bacterium]